MKYKMFVTHDDDSPSNIWEEEYDVNAKDAKKHAQQLLDSFNATLREHERPRKLVRVEILDVTINPDHTWGVKLNTITIQKGGQFYDEYECQVCGRPGSRFPIIPKPRTIRGSRLIVSKLEERIAP